MVNTPPQERAPPPPTATSATPQTYDYSNNEHNSFFESEFGTNSLRASGETRRPSLLPAATAAAALASLHNHRAEYDWDSDPVRSRTAAFPAYHDANTCCEQDAASDPDSKNFRPRARFAPTPVDQPINTEEPYYTSGSIQQELLPSSLARSPPGRSSTLPPGAHSLKPNRPRKPSIGQNARRGKHERQKSKDHSRRMSYDRKAFSAEPATAAAIMGKRWEDLIDAAASATEEDSRDLTPVCFVVLSIVLLKLTRTGATIAEPLPAHDEQSNIYATLQLYFTTSVVHRIPLEQCFDTSTTRYVGSAALPFSRVID
jgi:hypothetical protein